jgi:hypothetical protein
LRALQEIIDRLSDYRAADVIKGVWNESRERINFTSDKLRILRDIRDVLFLPTDTDEEKEQRLARLNDLRDVYKDSTNETEQDAWEVLGAEVEAAITTAGGLPDADGVITAALEMPATTEEEVAAKLDSLTGIRIDYTADSATTARKEAWTAREGAITEAVNKTNLIGVAFRSIIRVLNQANDTDDQVVNKLWELNFLRDNNGATGTEDRQVAWANKGAEVEAAIAQLTPRKAVIDAFDMDENDDEEKDEKLTTMIALKAYAGGTADEQAAWNLGDTAESVDRAITALCEDQQNAITNALALPDNDRAKYKAKFEKLNTISTTYPRGNVRQKYIWNHGSPKKGSDVDNWLDPYLNFIARFKDTAGLSSSAPNPLILDYYGKNLLGPQAANLYNYGVDATLIEKGTNSNEVMFDGKNYQITETDKIILAKNVKIAENEIKVAQKPTDKPEITDEKLNKYLKDKEGVLNDAIPTWQTYIQVAKKDEVTPRQDKVLAAIIVLQDLQKAYTETITKIKNHWKSKSIDKTETGTIHCQKMPEVFGANWENELEQLDDQTAISNKGTELIGKIEEQVQKENQEITEDKPKEIFSNLFKNDDASAQVEPTPEVVQAWVDHNNNNNNSKLKTVGQVQNFLQKNVKNGKEADFVEHLSNKLPEFDVPPFDNSEVEKVVNEFLANKKPEVVIKVIYSFKLEKKPELVEKTKTRMIEEKDGEKVLDERVYPKKDGQFTPEAMSLYLYEKKVGASHRFAEATKEYETPSTKSHWDEYGWFYITGGILISGVGAVAFFWKRLNWFQGKKSDE